MIKKSVDYWVTDLKTPTEGDIAMAISAARDEGVIVRLHWRIPDTWLGYEASHERVLDIVGDDNVADIMEFLTTY